MNSLSHLVPEFIRNSLKRIIISYRYDVKLAKGVIISLNSHLEGKSYISKSCTVASSYIGLGTFIAPDTQLINTKIGRFCSIGRNVQTRFGLHPSRKFVSTHPAFFSIQNQAGFSFVQKQCFEEHRYVDNEKKFFVEIGNDVWIGNDVRIMDGVRIANGAIVGLGSIVTKNIEPYSINVGIPAKQIGFRFTEKQIDFLLKFEWWNRDFEWISKNSHLFSDIDRFQKKFG